MKKLLSFVIAIIVFITILALKETPSTIETSKLDETSVILAFGDSLTYGKGTPSQSYPIQLEKRIKHTVINAGVSGESSSKGLLRLPKLLKQHKPSLVILCHGGNDLIQQRSKDILRQNLIKMITLSKESGAQVLLVGIPNFKLIRFSTEGLYEDIADEENIMYEGDILTYIENDTALKSDRIHPNAKGYGLMAEAFEKMLKENKLIN